ncbi:SpoIIE family protein phosphatase [Streptomyces xantholiticus]|uniref:SpoIIE family protein phosphatase n=1 Tax=Streptomyces xantholiticus TaxID=68285 RepID=A0ABV1V065_9ACTN
MSGANLAAVYLVNAETDELRVVHAAGGQAHYALPEVLPLSADSPVADAVRSHQPLWDDSAELASYHEGVPDLRRTVVSLGVVPLSPLPPGTVRGATGCLVVVNDALVGFESDRRILLELYAEQIASAMDVGAPRAAEGAGPATARERTLPLVHAGTFRLDRGSGRIDADQTLLELVGIPPETFDAHVESLIARVFLDDLPTFIAVVGRGKVTSDVGDLMFRVRRPSGEPRWLHLRCRVLTDSTGRSARVLGVVADTAYHSEEVEAAGLEELSRGLADALTVREVAEAVVRCLHRRLTADRVAFAGLQDDRLTVSVLEPPKPSEWPQIWRPDNRTEWLDAPLSDLPTLAAVLRSGRTAVWPAGSDLEQGLAGITQGGLAVLPLSAEGRMIGVFLVGWDTPHQLSATERAWLSVTAGRCSEAVGRTAAADTERERLRTLQKSLLPRELPEVYGAASVARYLPAADGPAMGGDWYDVFSLSDDHLALVVGDVQGHSAEAAAVMGRVSTAVRAYAAEGHPPDVVLARANRLLTGMKTGLFATCCFVSLDLEEGNAWFVRAGHPPPLLCQPDVAPETLDDTVGPPLGVVAEADFPMTMVDLVPGAVVALVTNGLVESARLPLEEGMRRMCDRIGAADPSDLRRMADDLIGGADRRDDAVLLLLRYDGLDLRPVRAGWRAWRLPDAVMHARRFTARTLRSWGVSEEMDAIQLVVSELVTNAVVHTLGDVRLDLTLAGDRLRVAVTDSLPRTPVKPTTVDWEATGGRGLLLIEAMSEAWGSVPVGGGKQVWSEIAVVPHTVPAPDVGTERSP